MSVLFYYGTLYFVLNNVFFFFSYIAAPLFLNIIAKTLHQSLDQTVKILLIFVL